MQQFLESIMQWGVFALGAALFLLLTLACEVGFWVGHWRGRETKLSGTEMDTTNVLSGSMLALLAFMLSLTINFAQSRFEARRQLVVTEANAIGTSWLRAELIGGDDGQAIARLLKDYTQARIDFTRGGVDAPLRALQARTDADSDAIWAHATTIARAAPTTVSVSLMTTLNETFDSAQSQRFAFDGSVPDDVLTLLFAGSGIAVGALGFQMGLAGARQRVLSSLLLCMWAGGMLMMVDLSWPRLGNVRVDVSPLEWTLGQMHEPPASPAPGPGRR